MKYERVSTPEADSLDEALLPTVQRRRERRLNRHHLITYTLLFLSLVINMFLLLSVRNGVSDGNIPPNAASGLNIPWFPFPNKTLFLPHPNYESLSSSSDKLWEGLQSPNGGFYVQEVDGTRHNFGIAMFHQLHCLQNLRSGLQLLQSVVSEEDDGGISKQEGRKLLDEVHLGHCVDYLRQSILCAADPTIEVPKILSADSFDMITGHNVMHQCRDKDAVWKMSLETGYVDPDMPFDIPDALRRRR